VTTDPLAAHLAHIQLRNLSPETLAQRRYTLLRLCRFLECEPADLAAVNRDDLDRWQRSLVHLSPRYRSVSAVHVRQFFAWATASGLTRDNPAGVLVPVRLARPLPHPIGEADLDMAINCAPDRIRPWLVLAAYAGLRAGEIARLMRSQVRDNDDPAVLVVSGKGSKERIVPMSQRVLMELRAAGLPSRGYVFGRRDGRAGANSPARISHLCNDYLHSLGVTEPLHGCRHRFGSSLYRVSLDLRMTQEIMGHESPATTSGYVAWSRMAAVEAVERIATGEHTSAYRPRP
jgi:integrase/recombinase XerC